MWQSLPLHGRSIQMLGVGEVSPTCRTKTKGRIWLSLRPLRKHAGGVNLERSRRTLLDVGRGRKTRDCPMRRGLRTKIRRLCITCRRGRFDRRERSAERGAWRNVGRPTFGGISEQSDKFVSPLRGREKRLALEIEFELGVCKPPSV